MSTVWWLTVLALAVVGGLVFGYWFRCEQELARRASGRMVDLTPEPLHSRTRIGL